VVRKVVLRSIHCSRPVDCIYIRYSIMMMMIYISVFVMSNLKTDQYVYAQIGVPWV